MQHATLNTPDAPETPETQTRVIMDEPGRGRLEVWPVTADENTLWMLLQDIFQGHWQHIRFGTMVPGAVWEIKAPNAPIRIDLLDGYLTVDFGAWHFHVCIGTFSGVSAELAAQRRTARAELYRLLNAQDAPKSWGLRLYTGAGDQQLTVFFPNPFLTDTDKRADQPDWSKLALWDSLRRDYLGLAPDPVDRSGKGFACGG
ncbi:DUF7676 family protein [Polaromonas sp.]|uniref:DUF7676 family protein n=1 Tax=Polaromonas sp. TaxID=1869339 RepID=UPI002FC732D4